MHRLKEANQEDRAKAFTLADTDGILESMYATDKTASADTPAAHVPKLDLNIRLHGTTPEMDKTASDNSAEAQAESGISLLNNSAKTLTPSATAPAREMAHTRGVFDKMASHAHTKKADACLMVERSIDQAVESMRTMDGGQLQKVAQHLVNGYPDSGKALVALLASKLCKPIAGVEKTASATVFPTKEPYIAIGNMYKYAQDQITAEKQIELLEKEAGPFMGRLLATTAANSLAGVGVDPNSLGQRLRHAKDPKHLTEELSPRHYNRNKELNAKKNFYMTILYDDMLKNYDHTNLVNSYNEIVGIIPEASENPALLRQLMRKNLETGGQMDIYEMTQMADLSKKLGDNERKRSADEEGSRKSRDPLENVAPADLSTSLEGDGIIGAVLDKSMKAKQSIKAAEDKSLNHILADNKAQRAEAIAAAKAADSNAWESNPSGGPA